VEMGPLGVRRMSEVGGRMKSAAEASETAERRRARMRESMKETGAAVCFRQVFGARFRVRSSGHGALCERGVGMRRCALQTLLVA
jgi:hypothetical protein